MERLESAGKDQYTGERKSLRENKADGVNVLKVKQTGSVPLAWQGPFSQARMPFDLRNQRSMTSR
jgi:hypothetical protein